MSENVIKRAVYWTEKGKRWFRFGGCVSFSEQSIVMVPVFVSLGARLSGIPGRWWCSVRLSLPLICSRTADSQGACHRRRAERGLKCSARYSKRCLINNVSERTRWDTAGLHCLSPAHTHICAETDQTFPPCSRLQEPPHPSNVHLNIQI